MTIKKFQAETENEAILLAKEELGKDAIVMNIKTVKPRGLQKLFKKPFVEVTAAIDESVNMNSGEELLNKIQEIKKLTEVGDINRDSNKSDAVRLDSAWEGPSAIEQKLNNLQELLEQQVRYSKLVEKESKSDLPKPEEIEETKNSECVRLVYNQLLSNEVDEIYAKQIISEIESSLNKDTSLDNILAQIYQKIILKLGQPQTINIEEGKTKFIFFIGPTGVGKTTTIAKIASDFQLHKKAKVALITSDTYRIAAVEQLRTYANILGIPIKVVYSDKEIKLAKDEFSGYDIILVDTAGRSHKNVEQREDIRKLIESIEPELRETYLVLSAATKYNDLVKITESYNKITEYKIIFTKLDETSTIGNIYNIKMLTNASLSYATWGQDVPDDIGQIDTQNIAKQLLGGSD